MLFVQIVSISGKTEIVYEPDTDIDIEEYKLEPPDTDEDAIFGGEDIDPLITDQKSQETKVIVKKRKRVDSKNVYSCGQCEYEGTRHALHYHKKSKHESIRYPCDLCEYTATQLSSLKQHEESKHKVIRIPCDQYDFAAKDLLKLKLHKHPEHEGIHFTCDECNYAASRLSLLKVHKERKHEWNRYPLDQREYSPTRHPALEKGKEFSDVGIRSKIQKEDGYLETNMTSSMELRKVSEHKRSKYSCNECEFSSEWELILKSHKKSVHRSSENMIKEAGYSDTYIKSSMKLRKVSEHKRSKYSCNECEFSSERELILKSHKKSVHRSSENMMKEASHSDTNMTSSLKLREVSEHKRSKYSCDKCEFSSAWELILKSHKKTKHPSIKDYPRWHPKSHHRIQVSV